MADKHFDRLVSDLTLNERQALLGKLNSQSTISGEALYTEDEKGISSEDFEMEFSKLPWYYRFWYFFLSFLRAKSPVKVFEDHEVSLLGQKIEEKSPGLYDYQKALLLPAFHRQVEKLKDAAFHCSRSQISKLYLEKG